MAINFPSNPQVNDIYQFGLQTWQWDGTTWNIVVSQLNGPTGAQGPTGATGPASTVTGPTGATGRYGSFALRSHQHRHLMLYLVMLGLILQQGSYMFIMIIIGLSPHQVLVE
jgi:hypothetical protein